MSGGFWSVPRLWDGEAAFILGGGPSLDARQVSAIPDDAKVLAVNRAFRFGRFDACFWGDRNWMSQHGKVLMRSPLLKVTCRNAPDLTPYEMAASVEIVQRDETRFGLSARRDAICWNESSGGASIDLAVHLGARLIVLLGFDMHVDGKPLDVFLRPFDAIADDLARANVECLNATPGSALDAFPRVKMRTYAMEGST